MTITWSWFSFGDARCPSWCTIWKRIPQDCIDHMRLAHAVPVSIDLALPRFAAKDFQPGPLQSVLIATQEYAASPPSLASQSPCLNLDTLSSDESEAGTGGVPVVEPIVISDQELTVISVHSGDPNPDFSDEDRPSSIRIDLVSPIPSAVSTGVLESPSQYPTLAAPAKLSAVSSVLISPNRVRKDCSSGCGPVFCGIPGYRGSCSYYSASNGGGVLSPVNVGWNDVL